MHPKSWTDFRRCIFFMVRSKKHNTKYSPEFKKSVILDMRENHMGYRETARTMMAVIMRMLPVMR